MDLLFYQPSVNQIKVSIISLLSFVIMILLWCMFKIYPAKLDYALQIKDPELIDYPTNN